MSIFDILFRCNRFRSLSLLSPIVLCYGVFNRLIPDAALSASVDPMAEVAPKINNLRIFGKNFLSQKLYHRFNSEQKCAPSFVTSL